MEGVKCPVIPKSMRATCPNVSIITSKKEEFANLARTWIRLADDLERTLAFLDVLEDETEPERRTG
jgi:hypothetical protein